MRGKDPWPVPTHPAESADWPEAWRQSHHFDRVEVWKSPEEMSPANVGYACAYANRRHHTLEALLASCPPPARVIDLAAAQGNFTLALAGLGYHATWNDLRPDLADYVRLKMPPGVNIDFLAGNIFELGDSHAGAYDAVLALEVIEHVAHPDAFVVKLAKLLKPGGVVVLSTPNGGYFLNNLPHFSDCPDPAIFESKQFSPDSDGHIFLLYEDEMRSFAERAGLEIKRLDLLTNPLTAGHVKLRRLLHLLPDWFVRAGEALTESLPRALRSRLSSHIVAVFAKPN